MTRNNPILNDTRLENERRNMAKRIKPDETEELSKNGKAYHPKQSAANIVDKPDTGHGVLLEAFFQNADDADNEAIANKTVDELIDFMNNVGTIDIIYTGMNAVFTDTLQRVIDERGLDTRVIECYPNVDKYVMAGVEDYETSWNELYNTRNRELSREHVDVAVGVKVGHAPGSDAFTHEMRELGIGTTTITIR